MVSTEILILGSGQTGQSCLRYWSSQPVKLSVYDTRDMTDRLPDLQQQWPSVDFYYGEDWPSLAQVSQVIISPGFPPNSGIMSQIQACDITVMSDIECFAHIAEAPIIGVTGTNGKSTTVTLIDQMLQAAGYRSLLGGNIGTPALDLLAKAVPDYYVLELSSFQLQLTNHLPLVAAIILNIAPDHLDYHVDMAAYKAAKMRIVRQAEHVWLPEDLLCQRATAQAHLSHHLQMTHNQANVTAAWAVLSAVLPDKTWQASARQVLNNFQGLPHRCQWFAEINGVHWVNDSKGTNVHATIAAISSVAPLCQGRLIWVAGGVGKGQDFSELSAIASQYVDDVGLFGQSAADIKHCLGQAEVAGIHCFQTLTEVVDWSRAFTESGDVVVLSPACASFDQFAHYQARGDTFMQLVNHP